MANQQTHHHFKKAKMNLSISELIEAALARGEGELASNQSLVVTTGKRTGRSPKDRFIVKDEMTKDKVDWNNINQSISNDVFQKLWQKAIAHLESLDTYFLSNLIIGASAKYHLPITVVTELAWQNLFAKNLFIHDHTFKNSQSFNHEWTILSVPTLLCDGEKDGVASDAAIILNFTTHQLLIAGTYYAGEIKKGMFSVLNFLLPDKDVLPMHCAANVGQTGESALFFGLSGTGKTTLSADPKRFLIGDDEHGWSQEGIFNFEGGCYAKCIDLSEEKEPIIFNAIRYGTVLENVFIDPLTKKPDYYNTSFTQNTRAAYPREFIAKRVLDNSGDLPAFVIFLTCDLYGVLPPVAKLTHAQAAYYFLSGYTALIGSTEVGSYEAIQPTFSTCFGAPFFSRPPSVYAELLMKRVKEHPADIFLVNTGWTGGAHGLSGKRFTIPFTRSIIDAIVNKKLSQTNYEELPGFNLKIPTSIPNIDTHLLNPKKTWKNVTDYNHHLKLLIEKFNENFKRFNVNDEIKNAGPSL